MILEGGTVINIRSWCSLETNEGYDWPLDLLPPNYNILRVEMKEAVQ